MIHEVCCVRDSKSEVFGRPFFVQSVGVAIRSFEDEVNREHEENQMHRHPEDFTLYHLGKYNDSTGEFISMIPKVLVIADQVKKYKMEGVSRV